MKKRDIMKGYIYKYTFSNGKVYIGQTRRPISIRHKEHFSPSTGPLNPRFWDAYQKLGEPRLEIIKEINEQDNQSLIEKLNCYETYYIQNLHSDNTDFGYNVKSTGTTHCPNDAHLADEFREIWSKIAEEHYPKFYSVKDKIACSRQNELTDEEKEFVNNSLLANNIFSDTLKETINTEDLSINDEEGLFWLGEAIEFALMMFNEEQWAMISEYIEHNRETIIEKRSRHKIIQQYSLNGDLIREFRSLDEIRDALSLIRTDNIMNVIKGRQKTAYGYIWKKKY